ncbi:MAG: hypothetical protein NUV82_01700 [Candidatus Komeilibacteria bacterium]|nr:hypothetical protein [Candidatus Komeilibacteria bacterium]
MKKLLFTLALALALAVSAPLFGQMQNTPAQLLTSFGGEKSNMIGNLGLRGSVTIFAVPNDNLSQYFAYTGPVFTTEDGWWVSPQIGLVTNWFAKDGFILALWAEKSMGEWKVFTESELYKFGNEHDFYGYYYVDYAPNGSLIGAQIEFVNSDFVVGPHYGFTTGVWTGKLELYFGFQQESWNVRVVNSFNFQ